jgi:4-diphosphocytidyl-2-C-methyl-D-erythritol kinase
VFLSTSIYDIIELLDTTAQTTLNIQGEHIPGNLRDNLCIRAFELLKKIMAFRPFQLI